MSKCGDSFTPATIQNSNIIQTQIYSHTSLLTGETLLGLPWLLILPSQKNYLKFLGNAFIFKSLIIKYMIISNFLMIYLFKCRDLMMEFYEKIMVLGPTLFELLSEGLGLDPSHLLKLSCAEGVFVQGNYYPPCPELELTLGTTKHMGPSFITILRQENLGGLQVLHKD